MHNIVIAGYGTMGKKYSEIIRKHYPKTKIIILRKAFIIQEMNRETNTIGSKGNNYNIASLVIKIKEEIEKIREQARNIV